MTAYFDQVGDRIQQVWGQPGAPFSNYEEIEAVEMDMVRDCLVCSEMPGFPVDFRNQLHHAILRHGVRSLPINAPEPDIDPLEHKRRLQCLCSDLHTIFHQVVRWASEDPLNRPFSDDPRTPIQALFVQADNRLEELVSLQT